VAPAADVPPGPRFYGDLAEWWPLSTTETFEAGTDHGGNDGADGRGVRYLEWVWDPDPTDTWALTEYAFLLRDAEGAVRVVHETHRSGLFAREVWLRLVAQAGFDANAVTEETTEARTPRDFFVGRRSG
jgi:hypothetical protein